jgi:hypothetical protein
VSRERVWDRGVPQGSNLGPYLFLVMINDLPAHLYNKLFDLFAKNQLILSLYADDVNSILSHSDFVALEELCNYSIDLINEWCVKNGLKLNECKTNYLHFKSAHTKFDNKIPVLKLNDSVLCSPEICTFLGLRLNKNLNWCNHIDHLSKKLRSGCFALGRLRNEVQQHTLKTVYYAHIYTHIKNNIIFWGYCSDATRIFILQKRAIRIIFGVPARHSCVTLFRDFGVLTMPSIYIYECIMFVKKNINLFGKNCETHNYSTRNCNKLSVFQHSKAIYEHCPKYRLVHIYNKLPENIKCIQSISNFKKTLFNYLLALNLYSVKDFFV